MGIKQIHITKEDNQEINLIAAEINAKSKTSFLEDFFIQSVIIFNQTSFFPDFPVSETDLSGNSERVSLSIDENTSYWLRMMAVKKNTTIKVFMQSFTSWLANEHRGSGRVWIDDTPVKVLPVRTRK